MRFELKSAHYNALLASLAKNDVRYYLGGFLVDTDKGKVVATQGHIMTLVTLSIWEDAETAPPQAIYKPTEPKKAYKGGSVSIDTEALKVTFYAANGDEKGSVPLRPVDGKFPDYESATPKTDPESMPKAMPAFDPVLFNRLTAALGADVCVFRFAPKSDSMTTFQVEFPKHPEVTCIIAPRRV